MINLFFLVPEINAQSFNPTAKLAIPTGKPTNEVNTKIEIQPFTVENK